MWFSRVKQPIRKPPVKRVGTWFEAFHISTSGWWEMVSYDLAHDIQETVLKKDPALRQAWKEAEEELEPLCRDLVARKLAPLKQKRQVPIEVEMIISFHILYACLEQEFAHAVEEPVFGRLAKWYKDGYFPCGVDEEDTLVIL